MKVLEYTGLAQISGMANESYYWKKIQCVTKESNSSPIFISNWTKTFLCSANPMDSSILRNYYCYYYLLLIYLLIQSNVITLVPRLIAVCTSHNNLLLLSFSIYFFTLSYCLSSFENIFVWWSGFREVGAL